MAARKLFCTFISLFTELNGIHLLSPLAPITGQKKTMEPATAPQLIVTATMAKLLTLPS